jgi:putative transport protein
MEWLGAMLTKYPSSRSISRSGRLLGSAAFRIGSFSLGGVTGSLIAGIADRLGVRGAGLVLGQVGGVPAVPVRHRLRGRAAVLPRHARRGLALRALGAFVPIVGLLTAWLVAKSSASIPGSPLDCCRVADRVARDGHGDRGHQRAAAVRRETKARLVAHVGVRDAICLRGRRVRRDPDLRRDRAGLLRVDLRAAARELEAQYGIKRNALGVVPAWQPFEVRATAWQRTRVRWAARCARPSSARAGARLFVQRIRRGDG